MNFTGLLVGLSTFLIIGLFHPLVIKAEYYIGIKSWIIFAIAGVLFGIASIMVSHLIWSAILGGHPEEVASRITRMQYEQDIIDTSID